MLVSPYYYDFEGKHERKIIATQFDWFVYVLRSHNNRQENKVSNGQTWMVPSWNPNNNNDCPLDTKRKRLKENKSIRK